MAGIDLMRERTATGADCDRLVRAHPDDLEAYRCYWVVARQHQRWGEAAARLETRLRLRPDDQRARLYLGLIEADRFRPRTEALLEAAAQGFADQHDREGEHKARLGLEQYLRSQGRLEEAERQVGLADAVARVSNDRMLTAWTDLARARLAEARSDYPREASLFGQLELETATWGEPALRAAVMIGVANAAWSMGDMDKSFDRYHQAADLRHSLGDTFAEATALYNQALAAGGLFTRGRLGLPEVRDLINEAVAVGQRGGNMQAEAEARLLAAQDPELGGNAKIEQATRALALLRKVGNMSKTSFALRTLASLKSYFGTARDFPDVLSLLDEAVAMARSTGNEEDMARCHIQKAGILRDKSPDGKKTAISELIAAIENIEKLRDLQRDDLVRARFLWNWAFVYNRLAGLLLDLSYGQASREDLDLAFRTMERLKARILLDSMDAAEATATGEEAGEERRMRRTVLDRIATVQRRLLATGLTDHERAADLAELGGLEMQETELRERIARSSPSFALLRRPEIPGIPEVQSVLADDQALVAFQISTREITPRMANWNGGSWAMVVTRDAVRTVPLPERDALEERISVFLGLLQRRDELEREAGGRLYDDLLRTALEELPDRIKRIVAVPDGILHRLPPAALRAGAGGDPLAARFEISVVPSAALWHRWKLSAVTVGSSAALSIADPILPGMGDQPASERLTSLSRGLRLGPLPGARREAGTLVRWIGNGSRLITGSEASERFLKTVDLRPFEILHLATHAITDDRQPQRSALVMSPGAPEEDGLMQLREVVGLDLQGKLIILSSCGSATGELTAGDGVVGLARAFFQAGARTVIASLWPLRDEEAAWLVEETSRHLSLGATAGQALNAAKRARIAAGAPSAAWAGLVLLGDSDLVPVPGGRRAAEWTPLETAITAAALLAAALIFVLRQRKIGRNSPSS